MRRAIGGLWLVLTALAAAQGGGPEAPPPPAENPVHYGVVNDQELQQLTGDHNPFSAARTVLDEGARSVIACATHGVFSGPAFERLPYENSGLEKIVVTDTIPLRPGAPDNIHVLSTAGTLADSIRRCPHRGCSTDYLCPTPLECDRPVLSPRTWYRCQR